eukprot:CCRYP_016601-RB/>CCRYP_016601-RB protein AED:0.06 eAED:0.06 QI:244/1/1/1/0.75/0.76/13/968/1468
MEEDTTPPLLTRPRILALCGAKSNNVVTKLQLENLEITEESHEIFYLPGWKEVPEGDPELVGMVYGPFYSWMDEHTSDPKTDIITSVRYVLDAIAEYGPFDGVYGFSQGALIASLVAGISQDYFLKEVIQSEDIVSPSTSMIRRSACETPGTMTHNSSTRATRATETSASSISSLKNSVLGLFSPRGGSKGLVRGEFEPPFKFAILACGTGYSFIKGIDITVHGVGIQDDGEGGGTLINVKSIHIIGIEDQHKTESEGLASLYLKPYVLYSPGGHGISRDIKTHRDMIGDIREFVSSEGDPVEIPLSNVYFTLNEVSSIAVQPHIQMALVRLKEHLLPGGQKHRATILDCLAAQDESKPFLNDARDRVGSNSTTYGDLKDFIQGGHGDLRRIGVKFGDVVAYGAPPGGSAAAAVAFLAIGAQTAAAPLAPNMTEREALDSLDQFHAKHVIIFEGVETPGVEEAFRKWEELGKGVVHRAKIAGKPGLFQFTTEQVTDFASCIPLDNPEHGTCLLLRTSGTTARPKGVPLKQGALVVNGAIIAKSMQLTDTDVCYSVMPLFHIGGLSASVLCTLASGGQLCCDGEPFDPSRMIDALAVSNPQPTWYSSVPTIHNATVAFMKDFAKGDSKLARYGIKNDGTWPSGHSLRQIRSGAASLLSPDAAALSKAYGDVPIYPTYSMSEQMPISQPPAGKGDTIFTKPGSVGCPVAASVAIVSRVDYRPQPYGVEGEIAICGKMVMDRYLENPSADSKSYFLLTKGNDGPLNSCKFFLTGDIGVIDSEGFLTLKGRAKELIKKGGEQVSPYEVEEALLGHPWVLTPICFSVPSKVYGEEVGCAIILSSEAPTEVEQKVVIKQMRQWMKEKKLAPVKWPTKWAIVEDSMIPKTATKKYIRTGLSTILGFDEECDTRTMRETRETKAEIDWAVITGFRFILACYVLFMHIGDNNSWGRMNHLRGFPWHMHVFFTLGGFSMASPMNPFIKKKFSFFLCRIGNMYPMYSIALVLLLFNLLVGCRPSTFDPNFHWDSQPDDLTRGLFCEGTPATKTSYWASLCLTIAVYIFGVASTPFWPLNWWMGYYLWFSSMYYLCLAFFPSVYNYFCEKWRKKTTGLFIWIVSLLLINGVIIMTAWFSLRYLQGYNHYNIETGEPNPPSEYTNGMPSNVAVLTFYLFGPFWALYFIIGISLAFLYDAYKPAERHNSLMWGWIADSCTLIMIGLSIAMICQPLQQYDEEPTPYYMRPNDADEFTDNASINRLWDNLMGRIMAPLTTLWIFSLSTGKGFTARLLRGRFLVETLGPNGYNCFLFGQQVGQWYYAATRPGEWWNWWNYRKTFYWFSPQPCPVEWYEYFYIVGLVVFFSRFVDMHLMPGVKDILSTFSRLISGNVEEEDVNIEATLCGIIEKMTGIEPGLESTLEECGLASVGVPIIVNLLNNNFSTKKQPLEVTAQDVMNARTVGGIIEVVKASRDRMLHDGV